MEFQWNIAPQKSGKLPKTTFVCQAGRKYIQNMAKILFSQNCKILQEIFIGGGIYWVQTYFTWSLRVFYCFLSLWTPLSTVWAICRNVLSKQGQNHIFNYLILDWTADTVFLIRIIYVMKVRLQFGRTINQGKSNSSASFQPTFCLNVNFVKNEQIKFSMKTSFAVLTADCWLLR